MKLVLSIIICGFIYEHISYAEYFSVKKFSCDGRERASLYGEQIYYSQKKQLFGHGKVDIDPEGKECKFIDILPVFTYRYGSGETSIINYSWFFFRKIKSYEEYSEFDFKPFLRQAVRIDCNRVRLPFKGSVFESANLKLSHEEKTLKLKKFDSCENAVFELY